MVECLSIGIRTFLLVISNINKKKCKLKNNNLNQFAFRTCLHEKIKHRKIFWAEKWEFGGRLKT
jgi:hypothetical protein